MRSGPEPAGELGGIVMKNGFQPQLKGTPPPENSRTDMTDGADASDLWQEAQDRVLLYLKKLGIPALRSLEFADRALKQAKAEERMSGSGLLPVQLVMRALHEMIQTDENILSCGKYNDYPIVYSRRRQGNSLRESGIIRDLSASPPINRGSMVIKKI